MRRERVHLVYYVLTRDWETLYVGRTCNLPERLRHFEKRTGIKPPLVAFRKCSSFEEAAALELSEIKRCRPRFNKALVSSRGCLGKSFNLKDETKRRMSIASIGRPKSEATKAKMRKPKSPEHAEKLRINMEKARRCRASQAHKIEEY